jgi:hypothetical protein
MYNETKKAVKKAFEVGKILFSLGPKYTELIKVTSNIVCPSEEEVKHLVSDSVTKEEAIISELRKIYRNRAVQIGLDEKHGDALLDYISLLEEGKE